MESLNITPIEVRDFKAIIHIADDCFGKGYLTEFQLNNMISTEGVFLKATINKQIIGFSFTLWQQKKDVLDSMDLKYSSVKLDLPYGVIKTIAIKTDYQKQGFGSYLIEVTIKKMKSDFGAKVFLYLAWTESKSFQFTSKLKKLGFRTIEIIPKYWHNESLKLNYGCLRCGNPPCNCSLTLLKLSK